MYHFCSVADSKFSRNIVALNRSLKKYDLDYSLHLLCLDKEIYQKVNDTNIIKYDFDIFLTNNPELQECRNNKPSREALINSGANYELASKIQFIWSLSSYFTHYCLNFLSTNSGVIYVDSDIYFFDNWKKIYYHTDNISVGLVEHRIPFHHNNGKYNVGILYFKKDQAGLECSKFWKNCLLTQNHKYFSEYGDCGDQKYLELFPLLFPNVVSLDKFFGHLAPWNLPFHQYTNTGIVWNEQYQNVMYYHFSNFKPDFDNNSYQPAPRHNTTSLPNELIKNFHNEYFLQLKTAL
jgi:hypothetical protein